MQSLERASCDMDCKMVRAGRGTVGLLPSFRWDAGGSSIRDQEMERGSDVVVGYLRGHVRHLPEQSKRAQHRVPGGISDGTDGVKHNERVMSLGRKT